MKPHIHHPIAQQNTRGSSLVMVMILIVVIGIVTTAMLQISTSESHLVNNLEIEKQLRSAALGAIHYKKTGMYYVSPVQFAGFLGTEDNIVIGGIPVNIAVKDNDDGDNDFQIDRDGALRIEAKAQRTNSPDYFKAAVIVRMKTFTEYSVAWRGAVSLGQNFHSSGNMFVGGNVSENGYGVRHYDYVTTGGRYYSYTSNSTTWDRDDPSTSSIEPLTENAIMPQWPDVNDSQWTDLKTKSIAQDNYVSSTDSLNGSLSPKGIELYFDGSTGYIWARPKGGSDSSWNKTWKPMTDGGIYYFDENIYIRGEYSARMTIVSGKDVYLMNDVVWKDQNEDSLGIMAKDDIILSAWWPDFPVSTYVDNDNWRPTDYTFPYSTGNSARNTGYFGGSGKLFAAMYAGDQLGVSHKPTYSSDKRSGTLEMAGSQTAVNTTSNAFGNTFLNRLYGYNPKLKSLPPPDFMAINNVQPVFSIGSWEFDNN